MRIHLKLFNTYSKLDCDSPLPDSVFRELRQELTYVSGNYTPSLFAKRPGIGWCFPTGLLSQVAPLLRKYYEVDILDYRKHVDNSDAQYVWNPDIKLHPYQHEAAALAVEKTRGIVYAGTGGGKTRISARTIFKLQKKAFVVVINSLAWQDTYDAYRSYFRFADIGVWAGDRKEIGDITNAGRRDPAAPRLGLRRDGVHLQHRVEHHVVAARLQFLAQPEDAKISRRAAIGGRAVRKEKSLMGI